MKVKKRIVIAAVVLLCCVLGFSYVAVAQQDSLIAALKYVGDTFKNSHLFQKQNGTGESNNFVTDSAQSGVQSSAIPEDGIGSSPPLNDQVVAKVNETTIYKTDVDFRRAMMELTQETQISFEEALHESIKYALVYQEAERLDLLLSDEQIDEIRRSQMEAYEKNPNSDRDAERFNLSKEETIELITQLYAEIDVYSNVYGYIVPKILFGEITCESEDTDPLIEQALSAEEAKDRVAAQDELFDIYLRELLEKGSYEIYDDKSE